MEAIDRSAMLGMFGGAAVLALFAGAAPVWAAPAPAAFTMWHDPGCGCCLEWARRIEAAFGRRLTIIESRDMGAVKRSHGVPADLQSCHTASIGGYAVEGHVPPADLRRLIASRNRAIRGLAVPGMPAGSPGMDVGHAMREPYSVYAFGKGRPSVFASHNRAR